MFSKKIPLGDIQKTENLARFIFDKNHIKKSEKTIKPVAFYPKVETDALSIMRIKGCNIDCIKMIGKEKHILLKTIKKIIRTIFNYLFSKRVLKIHRKQYRTRKLINYAEITVNSILSIKNSNLYVVSDTYKQHRRHALIKFPVNFPSHKEVEVNSVKNRAKIKDIARQLSQKAILSENSFD